MMPADEERLRSWAIDIVGTLIEGVKWHAEGDERKALGQGGLCINSRSGAWYHHAAKKGGWSAVSLISHLKKCDRAEAEQFAAAWLKSHDGFGECGIEAADELALAEYAQEVLSRLVDPLGTPAEAYLRSRGLDPPYPACVRFLPDARIGEGAVVGLLTANGRTVGAQLGYLDPFGRKSTVPPFRRRVMREKAPRAVFDVREGWDGTLLVAEGLEDALACAKLGFPVIGVPGIGVLESILIKEGESVTVVRDGDAPGSEADKALRAGIDHLIVQGVEVDVTPTPDGEDANSILVSGGIDALKALVGRASPGELSKPDGIILLAASLDDTAYEAQRKQLARSAAVRVGFLDAGRDKLRRTPAPPDIEAVSDDPELPDIDVCQTLDALRSELQRYVVASDTAITTAVLWAAHTHLVQHPIIELTVSPRLGIQAASPGCGKTIAMECLECVVYNPRSRSGVSPASLYHVIDEKKPTVMIDEIHNILKDRSKNADLLAICNASHRRRSAYIDRMVPTADGGWVTKTYSVWAAMVFAGIGALPPELQDRCVIVNLRKALTKDIPEHLEDGESETLVRLKRELVAWATKLEVLPRPAMPEELQKQAGRVTDNWRPLVAIAELAGGEWPKLARTAIAEAIGGERDPDILTRLLFSIKKAFYEPVPCCTQDGRTYEDPKGSTELETKDLIRKLHDDPDEEWATVNQRKGVTPTWLGKRLRNLLDPPGAQDDWRMRGGRQVHWSGYYRSQFEKTWSAYLIPDPPRQPGVPGEPGVPGVFEENQ